LAEVFAVLKVVTQVEVHLVLIISLSNVLAQVIVSAQAVCTNQAFVLAELSQVFVQDVAFTTANCAAVRC